MMSRMKWPRSEFGHSLCATDRPHLLHTTETQTHCKSNGLFGMLNKLHVPRASQDYLTYRVAPCQASPHRQNMILNPSAHLEPSHAKPERHTNRTKLSCHNTFHATRVHHQLYRQKNEGTPASSPISTHQAITRLKSRYRKHAKNREFLTT
jgi:hypothetical protein